VPEGENSADAGPEHAADAVAKLLVVGELGILDRFPRRYERILGEQIEPPGLFFPQQRLTVEILDLRREPRTIFGTIESRNRRHPGFARDKAPPELGHGVAHRRNRPQARDNNSSLLQNVTQLTARPQGTLSGSHSVVKI